MAKHLVNPNAYPWPPVDDEIRAALEAVYRDGSWGKYLGPHCDDLAAAIRDEFQTEFVQLACSGTIAVELALRGVGVRPGDEVVLAAYDFPGNFRAIEAIGARPVLVDIDPANWCLDAKSLEQVEASHAEKIKAVLVSHLHGGMAPMARIMELARARGWAVVEDACQAPGAIVAGRPAGAWGDASVLSFGGSKLLTAGRGGAVLTGDAQIAQRAKIFAERGNNAFPLSELQAAVLLPQIKKLAERNRIRSKNANLLRSELEDLADVLVPLHDEGDAQPVYYKMAWRYISANVPAADSPTRRDEWIAEARSQGVPIDKGFKGFAGRSDKRCRRVGSLQTSEAAAEQTVLLHHPILLADEKVIRQTANALRRATRRFVNSKF